MTSTPTARVTSALDLNNVPIKMEGQSPVRISDIGEVKDAYNLQYNVVRVDGQRSVYLPVLTQGGGANTIQVVQGVRDKLTHLFDVPKSLVSRVVFDQSAFVKTAISTLPHEAGIGLFLTCLMILLFLGSMRATIAVFFSVPLSALATLIILKLGGSSVNSMVLGGLALAFSRLIDNSVVVLENIHRHLEMGDPPGVAAEKGGQEVALPVLAATLTTIVVFFPVTLLFGVSKFLFSALALAVVISLAASYIVALTVVPLFCARYLHLAHGEIGKESLGQRFNTAFSSGFDKMLSGYRAIVRRILAVPKTALFVFTIAFVLSLSLFPLLNLSFFPRTDAGQFVMSLKAPSGTNILETEKEIAKVEALVRRVVSPDDLQMVVSNIGVDPGFSAIYTTNAAMHTAIVQVNLKEGHKVGSYEYIDRMKKRLSAEMPELAAFFSSGSLVDAVLNMGLQAPIDVQVAGSDQKAAYRVALEMSARIRKIADVADVFIPQDLDYPALKLDIDRVRAGELGLSEKEVVGNVITALTSNQMIAPNIWIDPRNNNNYFLNVHYPEGQIRKLSDLESIPLRGPKVTQPTRLDMVSHITQIVAPTEVDHYQIRRTLDIYVRPHGEDLGRIANGIAGIIATTKMPDGIEATIRGSVESMRQSLRSFAIGLSLSVVLLYPGAGGPVPVICRSVLDSAGIPSRSHRGLAGPVSERDAVECDVADGDGYAGRDHDVEQYSDCRVCAPFAEGRPRCGGCGDYILRRASAADSDDYSGHNYRIAADGSEDG